ncbi:methyl-accepting chemotaxis protein [Lachnospiraceae bacterium YSD2013]|nr:methyl-accepting chemotaxis protein [Lachnospiraceae bacterium YSD2013]
MNEENKKVKQLSGKLMVRFLPVIFIGIAVIISVVAIFSLRLIKNLLYNTLEQHVSADAGEVNKQLNSTFYYLNAIADSIEIQEFTDDEELKAFMAQSLGRYDMIPTGVYLGLNEGSYVDPSGWDPGKDIRESKWYQQGMGYNNSYYYYYDVPYFDSDTGNLCATVIRHVHLKDGREGVLASDLMMSACQEYLNSVSIFDNGHAVMITSENLILSSPDADWCGMTIEETGDKFYAALSKLMTAKDGEVQEFKSGKEVYYGVVSTVDGTDWKVIDYAKQKDVLSDVYTMFNFIIAAGFVMMAVIVVLFITTLGRMIRKPVAELTDNIKHIGDGDFTVEINAKGNDEIAYMNESMNGFISNMRGTIRNIKDISERLEKDSRRSKETAGVLSTEAKEQASSMEQILDSMESMAHSVTEVAENATSLAMTVANLTESERGVEANMNELVEKAGVGRRDMSKVSDGMQDIVASMNDMNTAVRSVDQAAEQINQIIDMINEIASQTNLLSLNASIEAARAGEAGKGFAVVATEIGQLANNSADATQQIAEIIRGMTEKVQDLAEKSEHNTKMINESSDAITNAADTFKQITDDLSEASKTMVKMAEQMNKVNDVAANMASVSEEQSATSQEITATINQLTESSKNVASSSDTVSGAATSVAEAADAINESVKFFTID